MKRRDSTDELIILLLCGVAFVLVVAIVYRVATHGP